MNPARKATVDCHLYVLTVYMCWFGFHYRAPPTVYMCWFRGGAAAPNVNLYVLVLWVGARRRRATSEQRTRGLELGRAEGAKIYGDPLPLICADGLYVPVCGHYGALPLICAAHISGNLLYIASLVLKQHYLCNTESY